MKFINAAVLGYLFIITVEKLKKKARISLEEAVFMLKKI
jgi:hypothetical protein